MNRDEALKILREHETELKAAGVLHLRLFGSVVHNEATPESDVDIMLDMDRSQKITLFTLGGLQVRLTELLGVEAHISLVDRLREHVRENALEEAIFVF